MATTEPSPENQKDLDPDRAVRLAELAAELINEIENLSVDSGQQFVQLARRARTNRRLIVVTIASLVLDVILSVFLALAVIQIGNNDQSISSLTKRLDVSQTVQRQKALCPLYQLFLDSESPQGRAAAPDPLKYDHAFVVIKDGYTVLGCSDFIAKSP